MKCNRKINRKSALTKQKVQVTNAQMLLSFLCENIRIESSLSYYWIILLFKCTHILHKMTQIQKDKGLNNWNTTAYNIHDSRQDAVYNDGNDS